VIAVTGPLLVRPLAGLVAADRPVVGGKAASLGELLGAGIRVPPGFVVTTVAFERALRAVDPDGSIGREIARLDAADHGAVARVTAALRDRVRWAPLPGELGGLVAAAYGELEEGERGAAVAVRSSATGEDSADASFAGLQDTYLWVRGAGEVVDGVRRCWASLYSAESVTYRLRRGLAEKGLAMGVVVQRMVDARASGVMFTRSPTSGDRSVVTLEASWGLGSAVVSGEVTPDTWVVSKVTGAVLRRTVSPKLWLHRPDPAGSGVVDEEVPAELREVPCLSDEEVEALVRVARRVERHYGSAQDVEWAIAREVAVPAGLFVLQSRPETVWSRRERPPVAAPRARAFDHVITALGSPGTTESAGGGAS
jgi:pyruvate, water dikinase